MPILNHKVLRMGWGCYPGFIRKDNPGLAGSCPCTSSVLWALTSVHLVTDTCSLSPSPCTWAQASLADVLHPPPPLFKSSHANKYHRLANALLHKNSWNPFSSTQIHTTNLFNVGSQEMYRAQGSDQTCSNISTSVLFLCSPRAVFPFQVLQTFLLLSFLQSVRSQPGCTHAGDTLSWRLPSHDFLASDAHAIHGMYMEIAPLISWHLVEYVLLEKNSVHR